MKIPTTLEEVESFDYPTHIDNLIDLAESIKPNEVTILVGSNSSGKSLIRKMMQFDDLKVASTSMQARTSSNPAWGALSGIMQDLDWMATSYSTLHLIEGLTKENSKNQDKFLVIDEPEIGCGDEVILGVCEYLNDYVKRMRDEGIFKGLLIITHSRVVINNLNYDKFIDVSGRTKDEWMNRETPLISLPVLKAFGSKMHSAVQHRINDNKSKNNG